MGRWGHGNGRFVTNGTGRVVHESHRERTSGGFFAERVGWGTGRRESRTAGTKRSDRIQGRKHSRLPASGARGGLAGISTLAARINHRMEGRSNCERPSTRGPDRSSGGEREGGC